MGNNKTGLLLHRANFFQIFRRQKWKLDNARKFLHKASNRVLVAGPSTGKTSRISSRKILTSFLLDQPFLQREKEF
jgi:hypothetical protein